MFKLGGDCYIPFNSNDIQIIFGIEQSGSVPIIIDNFFANSSLRSRCFGHFKRLNTSSIKEALLVACNGKTLDNELDVARIFCLFILCSVFLTRSSNALDYRFCHVVEDIESLKQYDWCKFLTESFLDELNDNKDSLMKSQSCTVGLLFWLCEHTTLIERRGDPVIPRFIQWDLGKLCDKLATDSSILMNLKKDEVVLFEDERLQSIENKDHSLENLFVMIDAYTDQEGDNEESSYNDLSCIGCKNYMEENKVLKNEVSDLRKRVLELEILNENKTVCLDIMAASASRIQGSYEVLASEMNLIKRSTATKLHKGPKTKNLHKCLNLNQVESYVAGSSSNPSNKNTTTRKSSTPQNETIRRSFRNQAKKLKTDQLEGSVAVHIDDDDDL